MTFGSVFGRTFSPTFQPSSQAAASAAAWKPTDIAGCKQWLDFSDANYMFTDAGSTRVSNDGDAIYQVNDKSGNSNHAVQSTLGNRPLYKTGVKNSKSVARFDGTDDFLDQPELVEALDWTLFVVFNQNTAKGFGDGVPLYAATRYDVDNYGAGLRMWSSVIGSNRLHLLMDGGTGEVSLLTTNLIAEDTWYLHAAKCKSGDSAHHTNGAANGTSTATFSSVYTGYNVRTGLENNGNAKGAYDGDIAEIIYYAPSISDADRAKVETYLNNKWAIY